MCPPSLSLSLLVCHTLEDSVDCGAILLLALLQDQLACLEAALSGLLRFGFHASALTEVCAAADTGAGDMFRILPSPSSALRSLQSLCTQLAAVTAEQGPRELRCDVTLRPLWARRALGEWTQSVRNGVPWLGASPAAYKTLVNLFCTNLDFVSGVLVELFVHIHRRNLRHARRTMALEPGHGQDFAAVRVRQVWSAVLPPQHVRRIVTLVCATPAALVGHNIDLLRRMCGGDMQACRRYGLSHKACLETQAVIDQEQCGYPSDRHFVLYVACERVWRARLTLDYVSLQRVRSLGARPPRLGPPIGYGGASEFGQKISRKRESLLYSSLRRATC